MFPPHLLGVTTFLPAIITTTFLAFCRLFFPPFRTSIIYRILAFQLLLPLSTLPFSTFRLLSFYDFHVTLTKLQTINEKYFSEDVPLGCVVSVED